MIGNFYPPFYLVHHDRIVVVKTSAQAVEQLLNGWPDKDSAHAKHALNACRLARAGLFSTGQARKAFERAAREAKLL